MITFIKRKWAWFVNRKKLRPIYYRTLIDGKPVEIDLTILFGSGNEPTVGQIDKYFKQLERR